MGFPVPPAPHWAAPKPSVPLTVADPDGPHHDAAEGGDSSNGNATSDQHHHPAVEVNTGRAAQFSPVRTGRDVPGGWDWSPRLQAVVPCPHIRVRTGSHWDARERPRTRISPGNGLGCPHPRPGEKLKKSLKQIRARQEKAPGRPYSPFQCL